MESDRLSILLDIKEQIGALNANMMDARNSRTRMEKSIDELKEKITPAVSGMADLTDRVEKLETFEKRISKYIWAGGLMATAILMFLWKGIELFASDLKAWLGRLFH